MATPEAPGGSHEPRKGLKWDGTISVGTILTIIGIAAPLIIGSVTVVNKITGIERVMVEQSITFDKTVEKIDARLKNVEDTGNNIRLDMAKQDGIRNMVVDHEGRIRALENKP